MTEIIIPDNKGILKAVELLNASEIVAFPTETVYGLGADIYNDGAIAKIFAAKQRPEFNPLISHVSSMEMVQDIAEINPKMRELAEIFWPGALTFILPRKKVSKVSKLVTAGLDTIAVRMPNHKIALELIRSFGKPLAAPSANSSGKLSPTSPAHVMKSLKDKIPLILAGGRSMIGLESTVIDLTGNTPVIVRFGGISIEQIEGVIGKVEISTGIKDGENPKSPGQILKHYSPNIKVRLNAVDIEKGEGLLAFGSTKFIGIKTGGFAQDLPETSFQNLSKTGDMVEAASNLFDMLHKLDNKNNQSIAVMNIPNIGIGMAINDRLQRSAA